MAYGQNGQQCSLVDAAGGPPQGRLRFSGPTCRGNARLSHLDNRAESLLLPFIYFTEVHSSFARLFYEFKSVRESINTNETEDSFHGKEKGR